jgi:phage antirepressor YoqD-like protein
MYKYINNLPEGLVFAQGAGVLKSRILVKEEALELIRSNCLSTPDDAISVNELCAKLNVSSPSLYSFLHSHGYYEKAIKLGLKRRRYYKIFFTKDVADEIIRVFPRPTVNYNFRLDDEIESCFITPDFLSFLQARTDIKEVEEVVFLRTKHKINVFIKEYMDTIGFMQVCDTFSVLCLSRQRVHQIIKSVRDDDSICIQLNKSSHSLYVSKEFIKSLEDRSNTDIIPDGYVPVSVLSKEFKRSISIIRNVLITVPNVNHRGIRYYDHNKAKEVLRLNYKAISVPENYFSVNEISDMHKIDKRALKQFLYNSKYINFSYVKYYNMDDIKPVIEKCLEYDHSSVWMSLTEVAHELNTNNVLLRDYLVKNDFINSEYIKPKNGRPNGKALLLHPELIEHLKDSKEFFKPTRQSVSL